MSSFSHFVFVYHIALPNKQNNIEEVAVNVSEMSAAKYLVIVEQRNCIHYMMFYSVIDFQNQGEYVLQFSNAAIFNTATVFVLRRYYVADYNFN